MVEKLQTLAQTENRDIVRFPVITNRENLGFGVGKVLASEQRGLDSAHDIQVLVQPEKGPIGQFIRLGGRVECEILERAKPIALEWIIR